MASFQFIKMAAAAILDFENFKFLTVGAVKSVELHHCAKFRQNRPNCGSDMAIDCVRMSKLRHSQPCQWYTEAFSSKKYANNFLRNFREI